MAPISSLLKEVGSSAQLLISRLLPYWLHTSFWLPEIPHVSVTRSLRFSFCFINSFYFSSFNLFLDLHRALDFECATSVNNRCLTALLLFFDSFLVQEVQGVLVTQTGLATWRLRCQPILVFLLFEVCFFYRVLLWLLEGAVDIALISSLFAHLLNIESFILFLSFEHLSGLVEHWKGNWSLVRRVLGFYWSCWGIQAHVFGTGMTAAFWPRASRLQNFIDELVVLLFWGLWQEVLADNGAIFLSSKLGSSSLFLFSPELGNALIFLLHNLFHKLVAILLFIFLLLSHEGLPMLSLEIIKILLMLL